MTQEETHSSEEASLPQKPAKKLGDDPTTSEVTNDVETLRNAHSSATEENKDSTEHIDKCLRETAHLEQKESEETKSSIRDEAKEYDGHSRAAAAATATGNESETPNAENLCAAIRQQQAPSDAVIFIGDFDEELLEKKVVEQDDCENNPILKTGDDNNNNNKDNALEAGGSSKTEKASESLTNPQHQREAVVSGDRMDEPLATDVAVKEERTGPAPSEDVDGLTKKPAEAATNVESQREVPVPAEEESLVADISACAEGEKEVAESERTEFRKQTHDVVEDTSSQEVEHGDDPNESNENGNTSRVQKDTEDVLQDECEPDEQPPSRDVEEPSEGGSDAEPDDQQHDGESAALLGNIASDRDEGQPSLQARPSWRRSLRKIAGRLSAEGFSNELESELRVASESLLDLLFQHLSSTDSSKGLSLPAAAVGWMSSQLYSEEPMVETRLPVFPASPLLRDRLSLLRYVLPRATHVRLTGEKWPALSPRKRKRRRRNWNYVTRGLTDVSEDAERSSALPTFLAYYDALVNRPRIDMRVFPKCKVLLLDDIPVDWIVNLQVIRSSLQLLRVERSTVVPDMRKLLSFESPVETSPDLDATQDPLSAAVHGDAESPILTHIKVSECALDDASVASSFAHLSNLQSLCLAHNNISSEEALSGLAFLSRLDLSFNNIRSLQRVHFRLGSIKTLVLSHNQLESTEGIDRLLALETLWLDHNAIDDLSQIRGLARLPELERLYVKGNPIEIRTPRKFRVELLDLFREKRFNSLPSQNATYRDLLNILPILDGTRASLPELKALVNRSYLGPTVVDLSSETGISERHDTAIVPVRGPKRTIKTRQALVDQPTDHVVLDTNNGSNSIGSPAVSFSLGDVLESLCPPEPEEDEASGGATLDGRDGIVERKEEAEVAGTTDDGVVELPVEGEKTPLSFDEEDADGVDTDEKEHDTPEEELTVEQVVDEKLEEEQLPADSKEVPDDRLVEIPTGDVEEKPRELDAAFVEGDVIESPAEKREQSNDGMVPSDELVTPNVDAQKQSDVDKLLVASTKREDSDDLKTSASTTATELNEKDVPLGEPISEVSRMAPSETNRSSSDETTTPDSPTRLSISFPDVVSNDDHYSVQSSVGTPHRNGARKFQIAEENSTYDGPETCRKFLVHSDLDLYFRLFVFPQHKEDDLLSRSTNDGTDDMSDWAGLLKQYPRIQLCPTDRLIRETGNELSTQPEDFRRLWKERVVGCGESALRRLTPNAGARYGFHGELLWSDSTTSSLKPEMVVESRELIACLSSTCLYFIVDRDKVANRPEAPKRKFPRPIPRTALFEEARWPHALARHPIATLRAITIGFGFQRLTLRFGESATKSSADFTYVLLTSNKVETVSLFKDLQDLVQENQVAPSMFADDPEEAIVIENDDRYVLDALGVAVAPDVLGVVLHYQILGQKWRRGDRGVVRRVCVVTDTKLFLLDEDYVGDGSKSYLAGGTNDLGETRYQVVDSAGLDQVSQVLADPDPNSITVVIRPLSTFQKTRNWRLVCRDRDGAERLVDDIRRALTLIS